MRLRTGLTALVFGLGSIFAYCSLQPQENSNPAIVQYIQEESNSEQDSIVQALFQEHLLLCQNGSHLLL